MTLDVEVRGSAVHGQGVFAARDFIAGETVNSWDTSTILDREQVGKLSPEERERISYIGNGQFVLLQNPERYINHSCKPNTHVKDRAEIAMRDIKRGEEITCDYSLEGVNEWEFPCNCGSDNCRGTVYGDFSKLDPASQKRLEPFLQDWYREEILGHREGN